MGMGMGMEMEKFYFFYLVYLKKGVGLGGGRIVIVIVIVIVYMGERDGGGECRNKDDNVCSIHMYLNMDQFLSKLRAISCFRLSIVTLASIMVSWKPCRRVEICMI